MCRVSRCFALCALITQARILKCFWVENSTNLLNLPTTSSDETWKISLESIFTAKQELIRLTLSFVYQISRLVRISLLISNLNKEFFFFFSRKLFHKTIRKLSSCVWIASILTVMQTRNDFEGLHITVSNSANPSSVYIRLFKHRKKVFYVLNIAIFRKILLLCRLQAIYL